MSSPNNRSFVLRQIPYAVDTEAAFVTLFGEAEAAFWLDSSSIEGGRARWSYLGDSSGGALVEYEAEDSRLVFSDAGGTRTERGSIFSYLDRFRAASPTPLPCPFQGGHVGWFGYELRTECGSHAPRRARTPDALFVRAQRFVAIDHVERRTYAIAIDEEGTADAARWVEETERRLLALAPPPPPAQGTADRVRFRLDRDRETYLADVEQCLRWIREGESYQICLTAEITCEADLAPLDLYRVMRRVNPAPYAAFLRWPGGAVLSASPECFLRVETNGAVETRPIKGTIVRDPNPAIDRELSERLRTSEKDRAENVMIVDLLRNDLSRVCETGSVIVPELLIVESFATVHQLVSAVRGTLRPGAGIVDVVRAAFPGGSMTGAPKLRTLELIDELEHRARGIYSGALGWVGDDGAADLSIVIRSAVMTGNRIAIGVGGGVVAQSTPEGEFAEMLLKAQASIEAVVIAATGTFGSERYVLDGADLAAPSYAP